MICVVSNSADTESEQLSIPSYRNYKVKDAPEFHKYKIVIRASTGKHRVKCFYKFLLINPTQVASTRKGHMHTQARKPCLIDPVVGQILV